MTTCCKLALSQLVHPFTHTPPHCSAVSGRLTHTGLWSALLLHRRQYSCTVHLYCSIGCTGPTLLEVQQYSTFVLQYQLYRPDTARAGIYPASCSCSVLQGRYRSYDVPAQVDLYNNNAFHLGNCSKSIKLLHLGIAMYVVGFFPCLYFLFVIFAFRSHSEHLVTNGVHKRCFFGNISMH